MRMPHGFLDSTRLVKVLIAVGMLAPIGLALMSGAMLLQLRHDAWEKAAQASRNLLQVIELDIARNIEIYDLSLRGVVDGLKVPEVMRASPELRQMVLFDRAASARDMGSFVALDENGDIVADAAVYPPRKGNYTDRPYFQAHKANRNLGLHVDSPLVSKLTGERMLPFSRRVDKPDGSFGGVVTGTMNLSYFTRVFDRVALGRGDAINLYHRDGTLVARHPSDLARTGENIAATANFERFVREGSGTFVGTSPHDGVERQYTFTKVDGLPLLLNVAVSTAGLEAEWRSKATTIGGVTGFLCVLTIALCVLFGRELDRRAAMQTELSRLSMTDALTGLPNRRRFDDVLDRSWKGSSRNREPLSVLIVDADHFKGYNDRYGHAVGDEVLKGLANAISSAVHRPADLVCRMGGEEFGVVLPGTDVDGAMRIADRVHAFARAVSVPSEGILPGTVTVSVGLACTGRTAAGEAEDLVRKADQALYAAKAAGRNRTECADPPPLPAASPSGSNVAAFGPRPRRVV